MVSLSYEAPTNQSFYGEVNEEGYIVAGKNSQKILWIILKTFAKGTPAPALLYPRKCFEDEKDFVEFFTAEHTANLGIQSIRIFDYWVLRRERNPDDRKGEKCKVLGAFHGLRIFPTGERGQGEQPLLDLRIFAESSSMKSVSRREFELICQCVSLLAAIRFVSSNAYAPQKTEQYSRAAARRIPSRRPRSTRETFHMFSFFFTSLGRFCRRNAEGPF